MVQAFKTLQKLYGIGEANTSEKIGGKANGKHGKSCT